MDFTLSGRCTQWREAIRCFIGEVVIPRETAISAGGVDDALRIDLQQRAQAAGVHAPQALAKLGGGGFSFEEVVVLLEEAGRSLLGRAKVFISEATARIVDRSVQPCVGPGTSDELTVGRIYADILAFRSYDGASTVHRMSIARRVARRARAELASAPA